MWFVKENNWFLLLRLDLRFEYFSFPVRLHLVCWRYLSKQNIRKLDIPFCILDGDAGFVLTTLTITGIYFLCCWVCCWYLFSSLMNCWFFNRAVFSLLLYFTEVSRFLSKQKKRKSKSESVSVGTISLGKSTKMEIT